MAVVGVRQQDSVAYQDGKSFGRAGPATMTRLILDHAVDPLHPANRSIVDLDLAERNSAGLVQFDHDNDHLARSRAVVDDLVGRRFLLPSDVERVMARAEAAWKAATGSG